MATTYSSSPEWADVTPIPQDDPPNALASIAYPENYAESMSYLRAVMAQNELTPRILDLTEAIIKQNAAHYTVWLYRAKTLLELSRTDSDNGRARFEDELQWLNPLSLAHQKNYQIWQHRQVIVDRLGEFEGETAFLGEMFEKDSKNYHVWSYRQWLVKRFDLWDSADEIADIEDMLRDDVRNNSAWNHRWYIMFGRPDGSKGFDDARIVKKEAEFAKGAIELAPQNQSPWNYLRGLTRRSPEHLPLESLESFAMRFANPQSPDSVRSSHALDILSEIYGLDEGRKAQAVKVLDLLAENHDPIRANYWQYRKRKLGLVEAPSTTASA